MQTGEKVHDEGEISNSVIKRLTDADGFGTRTNEKSFVFFLVFRTLADFTSLVPGSPYDFSRSERCPVSDVHRANKVCFFCSQIFNSLDY